MRLSEAMTELESMGNENTKRVYRNHGATEPYFGVKVADMKTIMKKAKKDHDLALQLYETGNTDAMYLAGLMADAKKIAKQDLSRWVETASWYMVGEYAVAGLAADSPHGWDLGREWIEDQRDHVSAAGWATLSGLISIRKDEDLDLGAIEALLDRVRERLPDASNRTRYTMNGFVISVGSYVPALTQKAMETARAIGKVAVDVGGTACKVPFAPDYIQKIVDAGRVGRKRKKARC